VRAISRAGTGCSCLADEPILDVECSQSPRGRAVPGCESRLSRTQVAQHVLYSRPIHPAKNPATIGATSARIPGGPSQLANGVTVNHSPDRTVLSSDVRLVEFAPEFFRLRIRPSPIFVGSEVTLASRPDHGALSKLSRERGQRSCHLVIQLIRCNSVVAITGEGITPLRSNCAMDGHYAWS